MPKKTIVGDRPEQERQQLVLVADDDDDIRALVGYRLTRDGFQVVTAGDGEEALRLAADRNPDLAILDVMMPRVDGYEVTSRLRASLSTRQMSVILLTSRAQEADVARGFQAGADDYLRKPFSPQELSMRVQAVLGRR